MLDLLFPGRRLVFESPLSREEITKRLERDVAPPAWRLNDDRAQLFEGTFADGRFRMVRLVRGRKSFRPIIEGQLSPGSKGARIDVRMWLHPIVAILFVIVFTIGCVLAATLAQLPAMREPPRRVFMVMGLVGALAAFAFLPGVEAGKSTRLLARLFQVEPSRPSGPRESM